MVNFHTRKDERKLITIKSLLENLKTTVEISRMGTVTKHDMRTLKNDCFKREFESCSNFFNEIFIPSDEFKTKLP